MSTRPTCDPREIPRFEALEPRLLLDSAPASEWPGALDGLSDLVCFDPAPDPALIDSMPQESPEEAPPYPLSQTFFLHSNAGASKVIYLDFDGHTTSGTSWNTVYNSGNDFTTPAYSYEGDATFSDGEKERIQRIWERVAEDYIPFDLDVTTEDPGTAALMKSGGGDTRWGIRVVIGGDSADWYTGGAGGVAYPGSFDWSSDTPAYAFEDDLFNGNEKYVAETATHEAGHTFGLHHDGTSSVEYYPGHGSGATGWAPIMGTGYYRELVQWSQGEYPDANQTEDDLSIITNGNGFGYRADDHGNSMISASPLIVYGGNVVSDEGIITQNTDQDYFVFTTGSGTINLSVAPFHLSPNLDILATLYNSSGSVVATSNPTYSLDAGFSLSLSEGVYYLSVEGTGKTPLGTGYSDYGSLGYYSVSGTLATTTTYLVNSLTDVVAADGVVTLREAIEAANTNLAVNEAVAGSGTNVDIIIFDQAALELEAGAGNPLTITLGGTQLEITDDLEVQGLGEDVLTIDANGQSRVFYVSDGETDVELTGLTLAGGYTTGYGGGIYNWRGTVTLTNSTVSGNSASDGGGICNSSGTLTLTNSTVSGNSARYGGGINTEYSTVTLTNSTVSGNSARYGGGIHNSSSGTLTLTNSTVSGNSASSSSGGIYNSNGTVTLTNSTVSGNSAADDGGGIYSYGTVTLTNSTVSGNSAADNGGGICIIDMYGTLTLNNTIVALNDAPTDAEIHGTYTNNSSMVGGDPGFVRNPSDGGDGWGDNSDTPGVDEGANDDYGDLRLLPTSPAIDAGDNALLPADEFDLDGDSDTDEPLPVDLAGNRRIRGPVVDMGAYEAPYPGDANDDAKVDGADLAVWQQNYDPVGVNDNTFEMGDFDGNGKVDGADLAVWQRNYDPLGSGTVGSEPVADASSVGGLTLEAIEDETTSIEAGKSGDRHVSRREGFLKSSLEPVPVLPAALAPSAALGVSVIDSDVADVEQSAIATGRPRVVRTALIQEEPVDVLAIAEVDVPLR